MHLLAAVEHAHGILLCEQVDVVRVLDLVENTYDFLRRESRSEPHSRTCPRLRQRLHYNQVRIAVELCRHRSFCREVDISLVDHDNSIESGAHRLYGVAREGVAGRVVGRAYPYHFGLVVDLFKDFLNVDREVVGKRSAAIFHIVDLRTHFIHAICWLYRHHVVDAWAAEHAIDHVDAFIAAHTEENLVGNDTAHLPDASFELHLQRVGVAVVGIVVRAFVGVDPHRRLSAELCAGATVGRQVVDVFSDNLFQIHNLTSFLLVQFLRSPPICVRADLLPQPWSRPPDRAWRCLLPSVAGT